MADFTNLRLSRQANDTADKLCDEDHNFFSDALSAAKFALGFIIKNYYGEFDPSTYNPKDAQGNNYNVGSFSDVVDVVNALYDTDTPNLYARNLMDYGLIMIGDIMDNQGIFTLNELCTYKR